MKAAVTMTQTKTSGSNIQSISRAAAILRTLRMDNDGVSLGQIAARVDLPRSTVQRIVNALVAEGLVTNSEATSGYCLGPEVLLLARAMHQDITNVLHTSLEKLSSDAGETVDLAIFRNDAMVFIDQVVGNQRLRTVSAIGDTFPLTNTANGKAVLVLLDTESVHRIVKAESNQASKRKSQKTLRAEMSAELQETGKRGYALDINEHTDGICAVGIAFESNGDVYAISIPAPSARFLSKKKVLIEKLDAIKKEIRVVLPGVRFA